ETRDRRVNEFSFAEDRTTTASSLTVSTAERIVSRQSSPSIESGSPLEGKTESNILSVRRTCSLRVHRSRTASACSPGSVNRWKDHHLPNRQKVLSCQHASSLRSQTTLDAHQVKSRRRTHH